MHDEQDTGSQRALPEGAEQLDQQASTDVSPSGSDGPAISAAARNVPGTSSNVVPKEAIVRAAISRGAASGAISADEVKMDSQQQGQWVTASFDELPDR